MSNRPSHINLPTKPDPQDVFSKHHNSALDTSGASSAAESPAGSPRWQSTFGSSSRLKAPNTNDSTTRRPTFNEANLPPRMRNSSMAQDRAARQSFASTARRLSKASSMGRRRSLFAEGGEGAAGEEEDKPAIPALVPGIRPAYMTPLPLLPMIVLSIAMMSEFLSANVSTPFILRMVRDFFISDDSGHSHEPTAETDALAGLWTGNLVSVFFITQFMTSLLWASVANKYGRRLVLVASLVGSGITVMTFGTSGSLAEAICVRLAQGIFGGSIGVFRGSIRDITDSTNETRAYSILGFAWGMGGVLGPIIGGAFESPAKNYPGSYLGTIPLFQEYPYLLPTLIAGFILATGGLLATRLSWDGGPRRGRIALPTDKEEEDAAPTASIPVSPAPESVAGTMRRKASSIFTSEGQGLTPAQARVATLKEAESQDRARRASRASFGTAYGYGGIRVKREEMAARALAARRDSQAEDVDDGGAGEEREKLGLAKKFLLANEENTFNLNELWVSAATAAEDSAVFEDEESEDQQGDDDQEEEDESQPDSRLQTPSRRAGSISPFTERSPLIDAYTPASGGKNRLSGLTDATAGPPRSLGMQRVSVSARRFSTTSGHMPSIFANTGLQTPPAIAAAYDSEYLAPAPAEPEETRSHPQGLSAIHEGVAKGSPSQSERGTVRLHEEQVPPAEVRGGSNFAVLPFLIIAQSALLAFHDTLNGQLFLTFLTSDYEAGGLGLFPSSFSILIALMCLFQLYYQFYLYPHLGPPRGKLNHLQMFRIGSALFIPAYLTLPLLRRFSTPTSHGGPVVMTLLTINMACRYAGGTFGYTSIMVLVNAMSPPHVVGLANGLSQSLVSAARFTAPICGGVLWKAFMTNNPEGAMKPYLIVTGMSVLQIALSFLIK